MEKQQLIEKKELYAELTDIFKEVFNDDTIHLKDDTTANDIGSWTSLSHMLMITEVENRFSIKFKLREISRLNNVGTLVELIGSKL
ncbi:MAG: acyl carrier protein [Bacteroidota bacterium]|nr:acyl carrier protein [Bacteroidota bacterium]